MRVLIIRIRASHPNAVQSNGKIPLYDVQARKVRSPSLLLPSHPLILPPSSRSPPAPPQLLTPAWSFHSGRVLSLAWTADGRHCASGGLDSHAFVWSVARPMRTVAIKNAAAGSVSAVFWLGEDRLASAGADGVVRVWEVVFHA